MTSVVNDLVREHNEPAQTGAEIVLRVGRMLDKLGGGPLTAARLAALDHFHTRGLAATTELAKCVEPNMDMQVLDAGSGLGGPSRYLAETYGCQVTLVLAPSRAKLDKGEAPSSLGTMASLPRRPAQ